MEHKNNIIKCGHIKYECASILGQLEKLRKVHSISTLEVAPPGWMVFEFVNHNKLFRRSIKIGPQTSKVIFIYQKLMKRLEYFQKVYIYEQ